MGFRTWISLRGKDSFTNYHTHRNTENQVSVLFTASIDSTWDAGDTGDVS